MDNNHENNIAPDNIPDNSLFNEKESTTNQTEAVTPEAEPAPKNDFVNTTYPPKAEQPFTNASTYHYTAQSNPQINSDPASRTGEHTPRVNPYSSIPNTVSSASFYSSEQSHGNTPHSAPVSKSKKSNGNASKVLILCLCASIFCSALFGALGVTIGYNAALDNAPAVKNTNAALNVNSSSNVVAEAPEGSIAAAAAIAKQSVVEITTETVTTNFFYGQYVQSGAGSGVIIDAENGYVITCAHVIEGASTVTVTLMDGTDYKAKIVGSDSRTDVAVIQIEGENLVAAQIGNSEDLVVGQTAIAIGNPLGTLGGTVSSGIISALNREITIDGQGYSLLQIDTSINPGNSGGGLFDIAGNLIGVVNAKSGGNEAGTTIEGLGFAIPINQAVEIANQLVDNGYVGGRVNLGIYVYEYTQDTDPMSLYSSEYADLLDYITAYGVYFLEYQPGQKGDFEFGDRIIAIDGVSVETRTDISSLLEEYNVGDTVAITVSRVTSDMKRSRIVEFETTLVEAVPDTGDKEDKKQEDKD